MYLLEFQYWTDVVMWGIVITAIATVILVVQGFKKKNITPTNDDPTGEIKQKIFDTLKKVQDDLENTV